MAKQEQDREDLLAEATALVQRAELDDAETERFRAEMREDIRALEEALRFGRFKVVGQVPLEADVVSRAQTWLASVAGDVSIARSPRVC